MTGTENPPSLSPNSLGRHRPSVAAVVLTYNRKDLLRRCLEAIAVQTVRPDEVIVVDNAGTDGTADMIAEVAPDVRVHRLAKNVGPAGGFNVAFDLGYRAGADHVWAMDDDVIAEPDALEKLLDAETTLAERGITAPFLISVARDPGGHLTNVPDVDDRRNVLHYQNWPVLLDHALAPVRRSTFVSILVPRATIAEHGLPIAEMFMWGEDSEYTQRVTRERPGFLVGDSRVLHVRAVAGKIDIRSETNPARVDTHFHQIRNRVYITRRHGSGRAVAGYARRYLTLALRLAAAGEIRKARIVAAGFLSGLVFDPRPARETAADENRPLSPRATEP